MRLNKLPTSDTAGVGRKLVLLVGLGAFLFLAHTAVGESDPYRAAVSGSRDSQLLPALLDLLLLAGILACFVISVKVKSFLRDGELASGWSLFSLSFVLLFVAQVLSFSTNMRILGVSISIISALRLLFVISLASGIYFMKKVLS